MWEVFITVVDLQAKRANISAVRTDPVTEEVYAYSCTAIIDTASQRVDLLELIKNKYLEYEAMQDSVETVIAGLEATAVNALNTWEGTR